MTIPDDLLSHMMAAQTTTQVDAILDRLPVVAAEDYHCDYGGPKGLWRDGHLHWMPVGRERGNSGRIKLAGNPINPIAERLVNGMEAIIALERVRETRATPDAPEPLSPRDAVQRYFRLPRLDSIPRIADKSGKRELESRAAEVRTKLNVRLTYDKQSSEFAVAVRDHGIGQSPARVHETLLSLGETDKADKRYMIGLFGQGGSSAYAASEVSIVLSRRSADAAAPGGGGGVGWSIIRQVFPKGRRDPYFAYLVMSPEGHVPEFGEAVAELAGFEHGTHFAHIKYNFGGAGSAVTRGMYQGLNHVLFNPILPYELFTPGKDESPDPMQGTAQRLARQTALGNSELDKSFTAQPVGEGS